MQPTARRFLHILVPVKRCDAKRRFASSWWLTEGTSFHRCVDFAVKIRVNPQQTGIDTNVKHSMVRPPIFYFFTFL